MSVSMMMEKKEVESSSGFMRALSIDPGETDERFFCDSKKVVFNKENSCTSSSSIGKNSDVSQGSMDDSQEVQSPYKGPLSSMEALQEVLPIRKGVSRFYNGKSKSFTSLREASASTSMKELAKPENTYIKKRRNILSCGIAWESNKKRCGISKRATNSSRTTLALAAAINSDSSRSSAPFVSRLNPLFKEYNHNYYNGSNSPCLSPLACGNNWRSFSLADLQQCEFVSIATSPTLLEIAAATKVEKEPT